MLSIPLLLTSGCDIGSGNDAPTSTSSAARTPDITDPLSEITDPNSSSFVGSLIEPLIDVRRTGPSQFKLKVGAKTRSVRIYIACTPASSFEIDTGSTFSESCADKSQGFADIPVEPGVLTLKVTVPRTTQFIVVVIPTPSKT